MSKKEDPRTVKVQIEGEGFRTDLSWLALTTWVVLFYGEPDLHDAIIKLLLKLAK